MINKDKQYRTRDGREVRIYATDGRPPASEVHGAVNCGDGWVTHSWYKDGKYCWEQGGLDLIEVKPRIKRTVWLNVYALTVVGYETRYAADDVASKDRLACVKVEIDCEEGEGL